MEEQLCAASRRGELSEVDSLLRDGVSVNGRDPQDFTPASSHIQAQFTALHWACGFQHGHVVVRLLEAGADVNAQTKGLRTPLHFACDNGHIDIFRMLVQHGADLEIEDRDGDTPLASASKHNKRKMLAALEEFRAEMRTAQFGSYLPADTEVSILSVLAAYFHGVQGEGQGETPGGTMEPKGAEQEGQQGMAWMLSALMQPGRKVFRNLFNSPPEA